MGRARLVELGRIVLPGVVVLAVLAALQLSGVVRLVGRAPVPTPDAGAAVLLTEVASSNGSIVADDDGDHPDWVELHNPGDEPVSLGGLYLSDDEASPARWELPDVTLEPGAYLVVWASGKDRRDPGAALHANFAVAAEGEPVLLTDGMTVLDRIEAVELPRDASYGRDASDPGRWCFFAFPGPGEANTAACFVDATLGAPTFSAASGFYDEPFALEISAPVGEGTIVYTLDGSYPDPDRHPDRTFVYEGPLRIADRTAEKERLATIATTVPHASHGPLAFATPIQKATVVRARLLDGAETAATYFVGRDKVRDRLPVVSLLFDEEYLFDPDDGIYVPGRAYDEYRRSDAYDPSLHPSQTTGNFYLRGRTSERPRAAEARRGVVFEFCGPGGACGYQGRAGVRIHGNVSRSQPQKSLRLYARRDYGDAHFDHPFFGPDGPTGHRRLILRNSGQDHDRTMFLDAYLQGLMGHFRAETQADRPVVVFLDGEYWGIHHLRERYDEHYLAARHGVDPERTSLVTGSLAQDEAGRELLRFLAEVEPGPEAVERLRDEVDLESFYDHVIAHVYAANSDVPGVRMWRAVGNAAGSVGRWRWMIADLDLVAEVDHDPLAARFLATDDPDAEWSDPFLLHRILENEQLRVDFLTRFADHLNSAFRPERAVAELDEYEALLEDEMGLHLERWQTGSLADWRAAVDDLRRFVTLRPTIQRAQLVDRFALSGTAAVRVRTDAARGRVHVNGLALDRTTPGVDDPGDWQGTYFRGLPVRVEAVPYPGSRFLRWEGLPEGQDPSAGEIELVLDGDLALTAVFSSS